MLGLILFFLLLRLLVAVEVVIETPQQVGVTEALVVVEGVKIMALLLVD